MIEAFFISNEYIVFPIVAVGSILVLLFFWSKHKAVRNAMYTFVNTAKDVKYSNWLSVPKKNIGIIRENLLYEKEQPLKDINVIETRPIHSISIDTKKYTSYRKEHKTSNYNKMKSIIDTNIIIVITDRNGESVEKIWKDGSKYYIRSDNIIGGNYIESADSLNKLSTKLKSDSPAKIMIKRKV